jgi:hypothetical protein
MTFNEWWHDIGSGITPMPDHDAEEHACRVASFCWEAARAAIYEAEAAQLTHLLRANNAALVAALEWALDQIDDDLDPDHQAALAAAHDALKRAKGQT